MSVQTPEKQTPSLDPASPGKTAVSPRRRAGTVLGRLTLPRVLKDAIYALYAERLRAKVASGPMPKHIGVVLDGNRRFALRNGWADPVMGHRVGTGKVDDLLRWCDDLHVPVITLWILSIDNLSRKPKELDGLLGVVTDGLPHLRDLQASLRYPRRIKASGRIELLPDALRQALARVEQETAHYGPFLLNIAVGYGGREEIVDAVKALLDELGRQGLSAREAAQAVSPQGIERHLYLHGVPDPDLIIRTSGEVRLSGFLLWQSAYSEYYFCEALWPDFREIDFLRAVRSFQQRQRRFGQ